MGEWFEDINRISSEFYLKKIYHLLMKVVEEEEAVELVPKV